jgi:Ca2+-binding RTX toxin-like protein
MWASVSKCLVAMRLLGLVLGLVVTLPASAVAGTALLGSENPSSGERELLYTAAPGEANRVTVEFKGFGGAFPPGTVLVEDLEGVSAGRGCVAVTATVVRCPFTDDEFGLARVLLGDRDDTARVAGNDQSVLVNGGPGNDSLRGGNGNDAIEFGNGPTDTLIGGPGNDVLRGASAGETTMQADPAPDGRDLYIGGKGLDTISYAARGRPVGLTFDAAANDGEAGEGDTIGARIDSAVGGYGNDLITGDAGRQDLYGGPGKDLISGAGGGDMLRAGRGLDADELSGGSGEDLLVGNAGPNILRGGSGFDRLHGRGGADDLRARDGGPDAVFCDKGRDRAGIDTGDFIPKGCERNRRRRRAAAVLIQRESESDSDSTTAGFQIGCPIDGPRRCKGRLYLSERGGTRHPPHRFSLARGGVGSERFEIVEGDVKLTLITRDRRGRLVTRRARGHVTAGTIR